MESIDQLLIYNARIIYGKNCELIDNAAVLIENNRISSLYFKKDEWISLLDDSKIQVYDAENNILGPALIDMHIHGCNGYDTNSEDKELALFEMAKALEKKGITCFQPTLLYDIDHIKELAASIEKNPILQAHIPGLYIEGPFINEEKKGGIPSNNIISPNVDALKEILNIKINDRCAITTMVVAPEIDNIDSIIKLLKENNVNIAFGHSDCTINEIPPLDKYHLTHLYNAMSPISHKKPGLAMLPFLDKENVTCEIVCDGVHVNEDTLKFSFTNLCDNQICVISDAMQFAGQGKGEMTYCNQKAYCDGKACYYKKDNTLIGSCTLIYDSAKMLFNKDIIDLKTFFKICAINPSRVLKLEDRGSIEIGNIADLIIVDQNLNLKKILKQLI